MASLTASEEETNFARASMIIIDLFPRVLRDLLTTLVPPCKLKSPIQLSKNASKKLSVQQTLTLNNIPLLGNYGNCDTSLLYILLRNKAGACAVPTDGWGVKVQDDSIKVGDDIERIREIRNNLFGHVTEAILSNYDYGMFISNAKSILGRFDGCHGQSYVWSSVSTGSYIEALESIETKCMDRKMYDDFLQNVTALKEREEEIVKRVQRTEMKQCDMEKDYELMKGTVNEIQMSHESVKKTISQMQAHQEEMQQKFQNITNKIDEPNIEHTNHANQSSTSADETNQSDPDVDDIIDDLTNHSHRIKGTSWITRCHHSKGNHPSNLLHNFQRNKYAPSEVSYQLYENGATDFYDLSELNGKFLQKFRQVFYSDMVRQPWCMTNLHEDCVKNYNFYKFCKLVHEWTMKYKYSFLLIDYSSERNLRQLNFDVEKVKNDLKIIGAEDIRQRVLIFIAEKNVILNLRFIDTSSVGESSPLKEKRKLLIRALRKGQDDLKLFSSLYMDSFQDICFTSAAISWNLTRAELHALDICATCSANLIITHNDIVDNDTLKCKLEDIISQSQEKTQKVHTESLDSTFEIIASRIWASISIEDVHLPNFQSNHYGLSRVYMNNDQRHILSSKDSYIILRGGYGCGKSIIAQVKFKELVNKCGPNDSIYFICFSNESLYTKMIRRRIYNSLPDHLRGEQVVVVNTEEYAHAYNLQTPLKVSDVLVDIKKRHSGADCRTSIVIDEFDASVLTVEEAKRIKILLHGHQFVLIVSQSLEVLRKRVTREGFLKKDVKTYDGYRFEETGMVVKTLDLIMRNSTRINELSRITVNTFARYKTNYFEREYSIDTNTIEDEVDAENDSIDVSATANEIMRNDDNGDEVDINSTKPSITDISDYTAQKSATIKTTEKTYSRQKTKLIGQTENFDHTFKVISAYSYQYTGNRFESKFNFPGEWTHGHSVEGCIPQIIYPFPSNSLDYHSVNIPETRMRMNFVLSVLINIRSLLGEVVIICFDKIDVQLFYEVIKNLSVPVLIHAPTLFPGSRHNMVDDIEETIRTHVIITDHVAARGLEFKRLIIGFNTNEYYLQQYFLEAFTRSIYQLYFVVLTKPVRKQKEGKGTLEVLLDKWKRRKLVEQHQVKVCKSHLAEDYRVGISCKQGTDVHCIHLWHEQFNKCHVVNPIKDVEIDVQAAMQQLMEMSTIRPSSRKNHRGTSQDSPRSSRNTVVKKNMKVIMLGLDGAGKTTLLSRLKSFEDVEEKKLDIIHMKTIHTEVKNMQFDILNFPGSTNFNYILNHYCERVHGLFYVVDSSNQNRVFEARDQLSTIVGSDDFDVGVPIVIMANKQDVAGSMTSSKLIDTLGLQHMTDNPWHIQETCAISGEGLHDALTMMADMIKSYVMYIDMF